MSEESKTWLESPQGQLWLSQQPFFKPTKGEMEEARKAEEKRLALAFKQRVIDARERRRRMLEGACKDAERPGYEMAPDGWEGLGLGKRMKMG